VDRVSSLDYQRTILGYHGCDRRVADAVLRGRSRLEPSQNPYDWLGAGIYFWEYGPQRALDWAIGISKRRPDRVEQPAVIGALIHLGVCFDLLDIRFTDQLGRLYTTFAATLKNQGLPVPRNAASHGSDLDLVRRNLDCAMLNWAIPEVERGWGVRVQTVRGVFQEGAPAYPGSAIMRKSHIQVVVRDAACILGYFRPEA
jgi:hypothetical protein